MAHRLLFSCVLLVLPACTELDLGGEVDPVDDPTDPCGERADELLTYGSDVLDRIKPRYASILDGPNDLDLIQARIIGEFDAMGYRFAPRLIGTGWTTSYSVVFHPEDQDPLELDRDIVGLLGHEIGHGFQWRTEFDFAHRYATAEGRVVLEATAAVMEGHVRRLIGQSEWYVQRERDGWAEDYPEKYRSQISGECAKWLGDELWVLSRG